MIKVRNNNLNILNEIKTDQVNKRLLVINSNGLLHYFYLIDGRIHYFYVENTNDDSSVQVGNVYIGLVAHVNKEIDGYFVNISDKQQVYLPGNEVINPILVNREYNGVLHESDIVLVQIKKLGYSNKKALASTKYKHIQDISREQLELLGRTRPKYSIIYNGESILSYIDKYYYGINDTVIVCSDQYAYDHVKNFMGEQYSNIDIKLYDDDRISISSLYSLKTKLSEITNEKVWLKSGGYLYINPTEAMTVIDINTGKTTGKDREKTIMSTNIEAIHEIAYQIEARNLSGIIIIDLINSKKSDFNTILTNEITETFAQFKLPPKLVDITKLGLAEITRQKINPDIYEYIRMMDRTILM